MKTAELIKLIEEVVIELGSVDLTGMTYIEIGKLMYEAKSLAKGLNTLYDGAKAVVYPTVDKKGGVWEVSPEVKFLIELGSARLSSKLFDENLVTIGGLEPLVVKQLKGMSKAPRPKQFYVELNGNRP
jgi:biotin synthase-related radical SAM superfamily protein